MQAYLPHSAERIAASPIGMNLGTAERSVVHARRWLCRAAWMICTGIHSDAAATNGKGVRIALRVCGEVVVGRTEAGGFDPFGRLEPTKINVDRGAMWQIGVRDEDCTPTLARAQGERRWRGGGPRSRSLPVCCAGVHKPQMRRKHKVELVVEPAVPHPSGSEEAEEHARRVRLLHVVLHGTGITPYRPECKKRNEPLLKVPRSWSVGFAQRTRGAGGRYGRRRCSAWQGARCRSGRSWSMTRTRRGACGAALRTCPPPLDSALAPTTPDWHTRARARRARGTGAITRVF